MRIPCVIGCLLLLSSIAMADDAVTLFADGTLHGWVEEQHDFFTKDHPDKHTWSIRDGVVSCDGSLGNAGFLRYEKKLCDFTVSLEYKMSAECNSGIGIRAAGPYKAGDLTTLPSQAGLEVQICDDADKPATDKSSGSFYGKLAPTANAAKPAGEWNTLEITCTGSRVKVVLNGQAVQDVDTQQVSALKNRPACGYLSLQNHGHDISIRNLRLQELNAAK